MQINAATLTPLFDLEKSKTEDLLTWELKGESISVLEKAVLHIDGIERIPYRVLQKDKIKIFIRHTSRKEGKRDYELACGNKKVKGSVFLKPSKRLYPIKKNGTMLSYQDNTPYIQIGANICWAKDKKTIFKYIDDFSKNGGNCFRLWLSTWFCRISLNDKKEINLEEANLLDEILDYAKQKKLFVVCVLDNHYDINNKKFNSVSTKRKKSSYFKDGNLHDDYKKRISYIFSRFGARDEILAWEICNEYDTVTMPKDEKLKWLKNVSLYMDKIDVDDRLHIISLMLFQNQKRYQLFDLLQIHTYLKSNVKGVDNDSKDIVDTMYRLSKQIEKGKPFCFSEVGYQGTNERNLGNEKDKKGLLLQQQIMAGFMLGGYGTAASWWWDTYIDKNNLWNKYKPVVSVIKKIDWNDKELKSIYIKSKGISLLGKQSNSQAIIWVHYRENGWYYRLVEKREEKKYEGEVMLLDGFLNNQKFDYLWISTTTGEEHSNGRVKTDSEGNMAVSLPIDYEESVLILKIK